MTYSIRRVSLNKTVANLKKTLQQLQPQNKEKL